MKKIILRMENVVTECKGVRGLNQLSLLIGSGEVVGMITVNQHGIKELIELLLHHTPIVEGEIFFDEKKVHPKELNKISFIERKIRLVEGMTIAENLFVIRENFRMPIIKKKALEGEAQAILNKHHISLKASTDVSHLTTLERCQVELLKAVISGAKLILIRDLGKLLSVSDMEKFKELVKKYLKEGIAFLYMSNYPDEFFPQCNRLVIYENGRIIKSFFSKKVADQDLTPYLPAISIHNPLKKSNTAPVLTLKKHGTRNQGSSSITLHQGECLTILDGNQIYLPNILDLIYHQKKGEKPFKVNFSKPNPSMLLIPENSIKKTLYYDCSYLFNLTFFLDKKIKKSVIPRKIIKSIRKEFEFQIGEKINLNSISSLNKYELTDLIYYRALLQRPDIVVIYQPFIDVDMDLQPHIEDLINQLKERMITVLVLTSYMANLELVSDQVVKIENGTYFQ